MPPNPPVSTQNAASSSDQLTAFKNITIAVNNLAQTFIAVHGNQTLTNITVPTVVLNGAGRCCYVSVITPGCAYGTIYDAYQLTDLSRPLYMIPPSYGLVFLDMAVQYGILVVPASVLEAWEIAAGLSATATKDYKTGEWTFQPREVLPPAVLDALKDWIKSQEPKPKT